MDKRIRDPLSPLYWLLRILAVNLISFPLTIAACYLIPDEAFRILSRLGFSHFLLIYSVYFSWTSSIAIAWRLRETYFLSGDISKIVILSAILAFFVTPVLDFVIFFREWNSV